MSVGNHDFLSTTVQQLGSSRVIIADHLDFSQEKSSENNLKHALSYRNFQAKNYSKRDSQRKIASLSRLNLSDDKKDSSLPALLKSAAKQSQFSQANQSKTKSRHARSLVLNGGSSDLEPSVGTVHMKTKLAKLLQESQSSDQRTEFTKKFLPYIQTEFGKPDDDMYGLDKPEHFLTPEQLDLNEDNSVSPGRPRNGRVFLPNSSVEISCQAGQVIFFAVPFEGYKFPLTIDLQKQLKVKFYVSYSTKRPGSLAHDLKSDKSKIEIPAPPADTFTDELVPATKVFVCLASESTFKTVMSIQFDSKDFSSHNVSVLPSFQRGVFEVDYKSLLRFSSQFSKSISKVRKQKKLPPLALSRLASPVAARGPGSAERAAESAEAKSKRYMEVILRAKEIRNQRVESILANREQKETEKMHKLILIEEVSKRLVKKTALRAWCSIVALIFLMEEMENTVALARAEILGQDVPEAIQVDD